MEQCSFDIVWRVYPVDNRLQLIRIGQLTQCSQIRNIQFCSFFPLVHVKSEHVLQFKALVNSTILQSMT